MLQHGWTLKYVTYTYHNQTKFKKRKKKKKESSPLQSPVIIGLGVISGVST